MKTQKQLINNITGQLNGISKMLEEKKDCFDVIVQMKAVRSAMSNLMMRYIEENLIECTKTCNKKDREKMLKKLLIELTKNNQYEL